MYPVIDKQTAMHYLWGDNCDAWVLADKPEFTVKLERMSPGTKENLHFHKEAQQFFYIITGKATFYIQSEKKVVMAQQGIFIEPLAKHFIANESSEDLEFIVMSQPSADKDRFE